MQIPTITKRTARRYVLGRQGLWPGRRWSGKAGAAAALRQAEAIQIDPISIVARSHDIALWGRVLDYQPRHLDSLLYEDRQFFDYGGILLIFPMRELPYWQSVMSRRREKWAHYAERMPEAIEHVLREIQARGPLGSRDFTGRPRIAGGFNTMKDTAHALGYLWMTGTLLSHSRRGFDRIYDLYENVAGRPFGSDAASEAEAEAYFALKTIRGLGLATPAEWARRISILLPRRVSPKEARETLNALVESRVVATVVVEDRKEALYLPAEDLPLLGVLEEGGAPDTWRPIDSSTDEEVRFLAPLDNVIWDRARTQSLFDFEYLWEVYKPAKLRRWGYYTLPILWGDRFVGRIDPKLHRKEKTLSIDGFWLDEESLTSDESFLGALAAGLRHFARFHEAQRLDMPGVRPAALRKRLEKAVK